MKKTALIVLSILLIYLSAGASNYHVKMNGSDSNNGLTFNTAFKTIQTATNKVVAGDTVFVYDGFYKGFDHFYKNSGTAGKEIVYLAAGANVVINQSCGRGFDGLNIEGSDYIQVIGFKVSRIADANGSGEDGIRAVLANHITVKHCEVDSCFRGIFTGYTDDFLAEYNICKRSYGEHGIYVSNNSDRVVIRYNVCFGNSRAAGIQLNPDLSSGAPGLSYQVSIYNNICYNNRIGLNLQGLYDSDVYNNLIYNNGLAGGGNGITLFHGDAATGCNNVRVFNNTVFVPATSQWAILAIESDSLFVYNNILLSASPKGCLDIESSCTNYFGNYNLLNDKMTVDQGSSYLGFAAWQALGHDRNSILVRQNADVFKDLSNLDFHLSFQSAARNTGSALVSALVRDDLDGRKRPQGIGFDIGCYETPEATTVQDSKTSSFILVQDKYMIRIHPESQEWIAELYDLNGRLVGTGARFEKRHLTPGLHVYRIRNIRDRQATSHGKLIVVHVN